MKMDVELLITLVGVSRPPDREMCKRHENGCGIVITLVGVSCPLSRPPDRQTDKQSTCTNVVGDESPIRIHGKRRPGRNRQSEATCTNVHKTINVKLRTLATHTNLSMCASTSVNVRFDVCQCALRRLSMCASTLVAPKPLKRKRTECARDMKWMWDHKCFSPGLLA